MFFAGVLGLAGCGDKYQNLKISITGADVAFDKETGVYSIETEYDEKDSQNNVLSFRAVIEGYDDSMKTTMTLSVPQDKILITSTNIRGSSTIFTVTLLTSGTIPVTIYSVETSKVFAKLEIKALLKTQEIKSKDENLNVLRPSEGEGSISYELNNETLIKYTPINSTARGVSYSLVDQVEGVSIEGSNLIISSNAPVGILPIMVKSNRIVEGSDEYDAELSDEEKEKLQTTIYAFVYDGSWKLDVAKQSDNTKQSIASAKLSVLSSSYSLVSNLVSTVLLDENTAISSVGESLSEIYLVYSATSQDENVAYVEKNNEFFDIYPAGLGKTTINFVVDLYYVPGLEDGQILSDLTTYKKVMSFSKTLPVEIIQTSTGIQVLSSSGNVVSTTKGINVFKARDENNKIITGAYVDLKVLPQSDKMEDQYRYFTISVKEDRLGSASVCYYNQNSNLSVVSFPNTKTVIEGESEVTYKVSNKIACGINGIRLYIGYEQPNQFDLIFETVQATDLNDVVSTTVTCTPKEAVTTISGVKQIIGDSSVALTSGKKAYIGLEDQTNGIDCVVVYATDSEGQTHDNQSFIIQSYNTNVIEVEYIENSRFKLYPKSQGTSTITIRSENQKDYSFVASVVVGVESFSVGYEILSGTVGQVTYYDEEFLKTKDNSGEYTVETNIKTSGIKTMYLQNGSKIKLDIAGLPNNADIAYSGSNPFKLVGDSNANAKFSVDSYVDHKDIFLTINTAGDYTLVCEAYVYTKDENGIWRQTPIQATAQISVYNSIETIGWVINGQTYYGDDVVVYDVDAMAYDKQPTFPYPLDNGTYYLSRTALERFSIAGFPSLNGGDASNVQFQVLLEGRTGSTSNIKDFYIELDKNAPEGVREAHSRENPQICYSIDYTENPTYTMATIWGTNATTINYEAANCTQAYSASGVWLAFTTILDDNAYAARDYIYEYKVTALITQAGNISHRATFTLRVKKPASIETINLKDSYNLEVGGIVDDQKTLSSLVEGDVYDDRLVYIAEGDSDLTYAKICSYASGIGGIANNYIEFDGSTKILKVKEGYSAGSATTKLTAISLSSMAVARQNDNDKYCFGYLTTNSADTRINVDGSFDYSYAGGTTPCYIIKVECPTEEQDLLWICYNETTHEIIGYTNILPIYKTTIININAGDTPNNPFTISNADEFKAFIISINGGNAYEGKYIKLTNNIYNLDLSDITVNSESVFGGVLYAEGEKKIIKVVGLNEPIFNKLLNASIQNVEFQFNFDGSNFAATSLIAGSTEFADGNTKTNNRYVWDSTSNLYVDYDESIEGNVVYRYGLFNVDAVITNSITTTGNFAVFAGSATKATFEDCSITLNATISATNLGGFVYTDIDGTYNHCILRIYGSAQLKVTTNLGGLICNARNSAITYSYILAFQKDEANISDTNANITSNNVGGLVCNATSTSIEKSFISAAIDAGTTLNVFANAGTIENSFANIRTNKEISSSVDTTSKNYIYTGTGTLEFTGFDTTDIWTTENHSYNDNLPILRYGNGILWDPMLSEIACPEKIDIQTLGYSDGNNSGSRILQYVDQSFDLNSILDTTSVDNFDVYLRVLNSSPNDVTIVRNTALKNVGGTGITFKKAGEWTLRLVSAQNETIYQDITIVVSYRVDNLVLSTLDNSDKEVELLGTLDDSTVKPQTLLAFENEDFTIDYTNISNEVLNSVEVVYVSDSNIVKLNYNNQEKTWVEQGENSGVYAIRLSLNGIHQFVVPKLDNGATISYYFVIKNKFNSNIYEDIAFFGSDGQGDIATQIDNSLFKFRFVTIPEVTLSLNEAILYTSDELQVDVEVSGTNLGITLEEIDSSYLQITQSETITGRYAITVTAQHKEIDKQIEVIVGVKLNSNVVKTLKITLCPTPVASVVPTFYQNGQKGLEDENERTSHVITPGGVGNLGGILRIDVLYDYSKYEQIEVWSSTLQNTTIFFTQYYYDGEEFKEIPNGSIYQDGKLILDKTYVDTDNGLGTYYVSTYIPNTVNEDPNNFFKIFISAKDLDADGQLVESFPTVEYLVSPGFVSKVYLNIPEEQTTFTDDAKCLVVQGQTLKLNFSGLAKNAKIEITGENIELSANGKSVALPKVLNSKDLNVNSNYQFEFSYNVTINASNGGVAKLLLKVYQNDMQVQQLEQQFFVVDKVITDFQITSTQEKSVDPKDSQYDVMKVGTNTFSELVLSYTYGQYTDNLYTSTNTDWPEISDSAQNIWLFEDKALEKKAYEYFEVDQITKENETDYFRLHGLKETTGLKMRAGFFIWYVKDSVNNSYTFDFGPVLPNNIAYEFATTINYEFDIDVVIDSTEEKPLPIENVDDLKALKGKTGQYYLVVNDLYLDNWEPFDLNVTNLDFNGHKIILRSMSLSSQQSSTSSTEINAGIFSTIGANTTVKNLILDISRLVYVDATDKAVVNFGFVAGINNGIVYNVDIMAFDDFGTYSWKDAFEYKVNNSKTYDLEFATYMGGSTTQDTFNFDDTRLVLYKTKEIFDSFANYNESELESSPVSVFILTGGYTKTITSLQTNIGGLVGQNFGYITNSRVGRAEVSGGLLLNKDAQGNETNDLIAAADFATTTFNMYAAGNVAGVCGQNNSVVSNSYYNGGYIINTATYGATSTKTAGLVAEQTTDGRVYASFAQGTEKTIDGENTVYETNFSLGGIKSQGSVAGLVHTNAGLIESSYSNIPLYSSSGVGGLVFLNEEEASVTTSLSLSKIIISNSIVSGAFIGVDTKQNVQNFGSVTNCYYLTQDKVIVHPDEPALALDMKQLSTPQEFLYGFSIEPVESNSSENSSYIWKFENSVDGNNDPLKISVKLIGAETVALGMRDMLSANESYYYANVNDHTTTWGTKENPIILTSVEDWNRYFDDKDTNYNGKYYRVVGDINFDGNAPENSMTRTLTNINLDGNGFRILNVSFKSQVPEGENTIQKAPIGLFGEFSGSVVSGVNIVLIEDGINAGNYSYAGGLAGKITTSTISNITVTTDTDAPVVGYNYAGGLAGKVENSTLRNIACSVSVTASYITQSSSGAYVIKFVTSSDENKEQTVSYAGGVAGAIIASTSTDTTNENQSETENTTSKFLVVSGEYVQISGEFAGGIIGFLGQGVTLSNSNFVLASQTNATQRINSTDFVAGGLVAHNLGEITKSAVDYLPAVQTQRDKQALNATDVNTTLGSLSLFGTNEIVAIGGLVGYNQGGGINNSYTRAEVVNKKAFIAGGLVGIASSTAKNLNYVEVGSKTVTIAGNSNNENSDSENENVYAINNLDAVYTTSMVYASRTVGGLVGLLADPILVPDNPIIVAINKMPKNSQYNYTTITNKGSAIGESFISGTLVKQLNAQNQEQNYVSSKYGIYVVTKADNENYDFVFEREVGSHEMNSGSYSSFVETYPVSYLDAIANDAIIFNGFATKVEVWVVDDAKTNRIVPTLLTNKKTVSSDITSVEDWNTKLKIASNIKSLYVVGQSLTETGDKFVPFDANNITVQGDINNDIEITVNVGSDYKPLFGNAENLTLNNLTFNFIIASGLTYNQNSLLCSTADHCTFNNITINIINDLQLESLTEFGAFVGEATDKITIYNSKVNGTIKLNSFTNEASIGGLVGTVAYVSDNEKIRTPSAISSTDFGNITIDLNSATPQNNLYVGGVVGKLAAQSELRGNATVTFKNSITSTNQISIGGLVGQVYSGAQVNSATVQLASNALAFTGSGEINFGGIAGALNSGEINSCKAVNQSSVVVITNSATLNFGGIVGKLVSGNINYANNNLKVSISNSATLNAGGVAGLAQSTIQSSVSAGDITITSTNSENVGGIVGLLSGSNAKVLSCVDYSYITLRDDVGNINTKIAGVAGKMESSAKIEDSCAYGIIYATSNENATISGFANGSGSLTKCIVATGIVASGGAIDAVANGLSLTRVFYAQNMIAQYTTTSATAITLDALTNANNAVWLNDRRANSSRKFDLTFSSTSFAVPTAVKNVISGIDEQTRTFFDDNNLSSTNANIRLTENIYLSSTIQSIDTNVKRIVSDGVTVVLGANNMFKEIPTDVIVTGLNLTFGTSVDAITNKQTIDLTSDLGILATENNGLVFDCSLGKIPDEEIILSYVPAGNRTNPNRKYYASNWVVVEVNFKANDLTFGGLVAQNKGIVSQCYEYADFVINNKFTENSTETTYMGYKFGGLVGNNTKIVKDSYIIGSQIWETGTPVADSSNSKRVLVDSGTEEENSVAYVIVYTVDTPDVCKVELSSANTNLLVWTKQDGYNYGMPMFTRFYNNSDLRPVYFTGNGSESTPYEIFDFKQLIDIQDSMDENSSIGGYFILAKDVFTTSNTSNNAWKYHLNGNGHSIFAKSYYVDESAPSITFIDGAFTIIQLTASVYNLNLILNNMNINVSSNIVFGGLAASNASQNIHDINIFMAGSSGTPISFVNCNIDNHNHSEQHTNDHIVYAGGLFGQINAQITLSRIYSEVKFVVARNEQNNDSEQIYVTLFDGAFVGKLETTLTIEECVSTQTANFVGYFKNIGSYLNISNSYTKIQITEENFDFVEKLYSSSADVAHYNVNFRYSYYKYKYYQEDPEKIYLYLTGTEFLDFEINNINITNLNTQLVNSSLEVQNTNEGIKIILSDLDVI